MPQPEPMPQPELEKVAEAPATGVEEPGDLAGTSEEERHRDPELRINWGTVDEALAALDAGDMVIVVLRQGSGATQITQEVSLGDDGYWRRRAWVPRGATKYSNRLRIVDRVPAFEPVADDVRLGGEERLAVLLPMRIERVLESAQLAAAYQHGVPMQNIVAFAGRFTLRGGRLDFDITHVGSERSATP